jgi:hypothetical protein
MKSSPEIKAEDDTFGRHILFPPFRHITEDRGIREEKYEREENSKTYEYYLPENILFHKTSTPNLSLPLKVV